MTFDNLNKRTRELKAALKLGETTLLRCREFILKNCQPLQPVLVKDRLPGPEDCIPHPRRGTGEWCWGLERCRGSYGMPCVWRFMPRESVGECIDGVIVELEAQAWLGGKDLPLPTPPEARS